MEQDSAVATTIVVFGISIETGEVQGTAASFETEVVVETFLRSNEKGSQFMKLM